MPGLAAGSGKSFALRKEENFFLLACLTFLGKFLAVAV